LHHTVVRLVYDLVDGVWGRRAVGVLAVVLGEFFGDLMQPFVEKALGAGIKRRETADYPGFALCNDQFWS